MILQLALGILTAIGGFIDVGAIATTALAGALFGYQLLWAVLLGTLCVILLTEMCGRLAAVSHHTVADAVRERLGIRYFALPLCLEVIVDTMVLGAEIGGIVQSVTVESNNHLFLSLSQAGRRVRCVFPGEWKKPLPS